MSEWVSERLLSNTNSAISQLCHGENKIIVNELMTRFALFYTNTLSWIFIVLAHWNNSPRVDMSIHSETLFWFRANQSFLFLLNAACLAEKQHIPILYSMVWTDPGVNPRSAALDTSMLSITPPILYWKVYDVIA